MKAIIYCMCMFTLSLALVPTITEKGHCSEPMGMTDDIRSIETAKINCDRQSRSYFGYIPGHIPILISAPHGAKHYRLKEHSWKAEDAYTSSFAIKLGQLTGAHVIYAKNKSKEDPNSDIRCRYKDFLRKVVKENGIKFIVDIHGADRHHKFKIDVGTIGDTPESSSCPTFMPLIEKAFRDFDEGVFNKHFRARGNGTITSFARNDLGIEAAQFEINALYRVVESKSNLSAPAKDTYVLDVMQRMQKMVLDINERIRPEFSKSEHQLSSLVGKR